MVKYSEFNRMFGSNKMDIWVLRKIVSIKKDGLCWLVLLWYLLLNVILVISCFN